MKYRFLLLCLLFPFLANSQFQEKLNNYSDSLSFFAERILKGSTVEERSTANNKFLAYMRELMKEDSSFHYAFDELPSIIKLKSDDGELRIINWNLPREDAELSYHAFIQRYTKEGEYRYFELQDLDTSYQDLIKYKASAEKWPGALYYKIIEKKNEFNSYYTLLGWDGNNQLTTFKVVDVLSFDKTGNPKFGESIFKYHKELQNRVVFEYSANNKMNLNYREDLDLIIFDHLSPPRSSLKGIYEYYGPDFSFDALEWNGRNWVLIEDIDPDKGLKKKASYFRPEGKDTIRSDDFIKK